MIKNFFFFFFFFLSVLVFHTEILVRYIKSVFVVPSPEPILLIHPFREYNAVQRVTAVTTYLFSEQLLLFAFVRWRVLVLD